MCNKLQCASDELPLSVVFSGRKKTLLTLLVLASEKKLPEKLYDMDTMLGFFGLSILGFSRIFDQMLIKVSAGKTMVLSLLRRNCNLWKL